MIVPNRHESTDTYRYGFQGQEKDDELKGQGNSYDFGARIYDPRVGRWLSIDPKFMKYPYLSPYLFANNNPVRYIDSQGKEPEDPIILYVYFYNDGVVDSKLSFGDGMGDQYIKSMYMEGKISRGDVVRKYGKSVFMVQDAKGNFKEVSKLQFHMESQSVNQEAVREVLSWTPAGDLTEAVYETVDGNYGMAAMNLGLIFIPYDKIITKGKKVVQYAFRKGDEIIALSAKQIWKKHPWVRGNMVETILAKTDYKDWIHTFELEYSKGGVFKSGSKSFFFPYIDFVKGNMAISLKTTYAKSGFGSLFANIDNLANFVKNNAKNGTEIIDTVILDIRVPEGYDKKILDDVVKYAKDNGVDIKISEFK